MRRALAPLAIAAALAAAPDAGARPAEVRIGVLFWHESPNDRAAFEGVKDGFLLARRNARFDVFHAAEDDGAARERLRRWDGEPVDLVYAMGTAAALRARDVMRRAPVVFTAVTDPVGSGVVASPNGSGGFMCGTASGVDPADTLAVFRLAVPALRTLGVVYNPENPVSRAEVAEMRRVGALLDAPVRVRAVERDAAAMAAPGGIETAAAEAARDADALWIPIDIDVYTRAERVATAAARARVPVLATAPAAVRSGGAAVGASVDFRAVGRASVVTAVRVLDGADPGTLPITRPRSYRILVHLDAARRTGYEIPLPLLASVDEFCAAGRR